MLKQGFEKIVSSHLKKKIEKNTISENDIQAALEELRITFLDADVASEVVDNLINLIKKQLVGRYVEKDNNLENIFFSTLKNMLVEILGGVKKTLDFKLSKRLMVVGLQGSGKTTTVAKIANLIKTKNSRKPLLVAADIYRPAAIDQLIKLAGDINVDIFEKSTQDPRITVNEAISYAKENFAENIIVDTAGRLTINEELMKELKDIKKILDPQEVVLVVDAMSGQDIINVAKSFHEQIGLTGIIITKFDSDARAGSAISIISLLKLPVLFVGTGEKMDAIDSFYPERIADRILGMGDLLTLAEKAQGAIDEKKAKSQFERILSGKFDFEDLLQQMESVSRMGSLSSIAKFLPTNAKINEDQINQAESKVKMWRTMIESMTPKERRNPKYFEKDISRRIRVIKGSGKTADDFNKMMSEWKKSKEKLTQFVTSIKGNKGMFGGMM
jgi:signal recognition particle subunit SRP54